MARPNRYRLQGVSQAVKAFKALPEVTRMHLGEASEKTAAAVIARARALVRVGTGALKDKLNYKFSERTGVATAGVEKGSVGDEIPSRRAHLLEFGHAGPHPAPAYPFMLPSAEAEREPFLDRCREAGKKVERDMSVSRFD